MTAGILAVDESASMRHRMSNAHDGAGYHVVEAADGVEALDTAKRRPVGPVIADINMPDREGIALIREPRTNPVLRVHPVAEADPESGSEQDQGTRAAGWIVKSLTPSSCSTRSGKC